MTVEAIEPHGFCSGVTAAVAKARRALDGRGEVFCVHELVHNETVVGELKAKGLRFVGGMDEVPDGGTVLFSAHGVGPATRRAAEARGLSVVDATCPFVARVHRQVRACAERGLPVVVVGHARHVEVAGVVDEARDAGADVAVVATPDDVEALAIPRGATVGVVCQTTLSADVVQKVVEALRARHPALETGAGAGVCTATRDRQDAVRRFVASGGDGVLVLGSETSSNTRRLVEIALGVGAAAWRAVDAAEVAALDFTGVRRLGVTSGASTPEDVFADVMANFQIRA